METAVQQHCGSGSKDTVPSLGDSLTVSLKDTMKGGSRFKFDERL
jgi:hypothetical protein